MESVYKITYIKTKKDYDKLCNNQQGGDNKQNMLYALAIIPLILIALIKFILRDGQGDAKQSQGRLVLERTRDGKGIDVSPVETLPDNLSIPPDNLSIPLTISYRSRVGSVEPAQEAPAQEAPAQEAPAQEAPAQASAEENKTNNIKILTKSNTYKNLNEVNIPNKDIIKNVLNKLDIKVKDDEWFCRPNFSRIYYYDNTSYNTLNELNEQLKQHNIIIRDVKVGEKMHAPHFGDCRYIWTFTISSGNNSYSIRFKPKELRGSNTTI